MGLDKTLEKSESAPPTFHERFTHEEKSHNGRWMAKCLLIPGYMVRGVLSVPKGKRGSDYTGQVVGNLAFEGVRDLAYAGIGFGIWYLASGQSG